MGAASVPLSPLAARAAFPYTTLACVLLIVGAATYVGVCQRGKQHLTHRRAAFCTPAGGPCRFCRSNSPLGRFPTGGGVAESHHLFCSMLAFLLWGLKAAA